MTYTTLFRIAVALLALLAVPVAADERIGAFMIYDTMPDIIVMDGDISSTTPLDFRRAHTARPGAKVLVLGSPGGVVASALILASEVHDRGLATSIPPGFGCYSSCAYVFLAGKERLVEGELGVHQMFRSDDVSGVQPMMSDVIETLERFGTPTAVLTRMFRSSSEDIYIFQPAEIGELDINILGPTVLATANIGKLLPAVPLAPPTREVTPGATTANAPIADGPTRRGELASTPTVGIGAASVPRLAVYGGLDFYGEDLTSMRVADLVQCTSACAGRKECVAFTFNANPGLKKGPNCFLKEGIGRLEAYADALSGIFIAPGELAQSFAVGAIDPTRDVRSKNGLTGDDFRSSPEAGIRSPGACRMACVDEESCRAFTYDSKLKQCFLKYDQGAFFASSQLTSGIKRSVTFEPLDVIDLDR